MNGEALPRFFPDGNSDSEDDINFWESGETGLELSESVVGAAVRGVTSFKYIDDTTLFEAVDLGTAIKHFTTGTTSEVVSPLGLGEGLDTIAAGAKEIGMKVNVKKTQLLCISPNNGCLTSAAIATDAEPIVSSATLKLVGFTFGETPNVAAHVMAVKLSYRRKVWFLFHLREAGIKGNDLYKLYCCYIRAIIEYLSPVYHSMLLKGQAEDLEKLHRHALRVCFGQALDIRTVMQDLGIETLAARRQRRVDSFIRKSANNPRFGHWFPLRGEPAVELRGRRNIAELRSKTERRHNGPIAYMRRRANELGILPGGA